MDIIMQSKILYVISELNYCEKNQDTCKNGGKCQSLETADGSFRCHCPPGISGKHCENLPESMTTPASNTTEVPEEGNGGIEEVDEVETTTISLDSAEPSDGENETEWYI